MAARSPRGGGGGAGQAARYGLIVWLRAESAESLAADIRSLAIDSGIATQGLRNEEVVAEVMSRLYRTRVCWLLVFDNVSSRRLIDEHVPRGSGGTDGGTDRFEEIFACISAYGWRRCKQYAVLWLDQPLT